MNILAMEYDVEVAKRIYAEEQMEELAKEMLVDGESIEKIIKWTKLSRETINELQRQFQS